MDIVQRNFLSLLRHGALSDDVLLEPMTEFKWKKVITLAKALKTEDYVCNCLQSPTLLQSIPQNIVALIEKIDNESSQRKDKDSETDTPRLSNIFLNKLLDNIRDNEIHAIDTSTESLHLLDLIVLNCHYILTFGISLRHLLQLGEYLRTQGQRVDFVKIDRWLQKLRLQRMAQFEGNLLVSLFQFEQDEIPFILSSDPNADIYAAKLLRDLTFTDKTESLFKQGKSGLIQGNTMATCRTISRCMRFFSYSPIECVSNMIGRFVANLSEIEE